MLIKCGPFGGIAPGIGNRLLPDIGAISAENVKLNSGELHPIARPGLVTTPAKTMPPLAIFRGRNSTDQSAWFSWPYDVDCVRAPLSVDVESRFYWTGDGEPRFAPYTSAVAGGGNDYPHSYFALGIPAPTIAPSVSHSGGSASATTRFYCYTFYSQHGEESGPSPISAEVTGKTDGTWSIGATTAMQDFPANSGTGTASHSGGYTTFTNAAAALHWLRAGDEVVIDGDTLTVSEITSTSAFKVPGDYSAATDWERKAPWNTSGMTRRLYRTTGTTGSWQLVAESVGTTYSDTLTDSQILGDELISDGWDPPPPGLHSLCVHPSGALIGIVRNLFCASEPYQPHAWPAAYQRGASFDGVGLAVFGSTAVMATSGVPFVVSGTEPASMSGEDGKNIFPCLSKRSVLGIGDGVSYASKHGMVLIGSGGVGLMTESTFTREKWMELNPESMICESAAGKIYVSYLNSSGSRQMLVFDQGQLIKVSVAADELYTDPATSELYIGTSEGISLFDDSSEVVLSGDWRSKEFVMPRPINLGAAKIDFDLAVDEDLRAARLAEIAAAEAENALVLATGNAHGSIGSTGINANELHGADFVGVPEDPASNTVTFNLWVGSRLMASRIVSSQKAFRLPDGYKADAFSFEVITQCVVKEIRVAETMEDLRNA